MGWLQASGITVHGTIVDTMVAGALIDENRYSYALNSLSKDYLGELKAETELVEAAQQHGVDPKGEMWKLPANYVGPYAEQDAVLTLKLWYKLRDLLEKEEVDQIYSLERELLPLLLDMRWKGVRVDEKAAEQKASFLLKEEQRLLSEIKKDYGVPIEVWNAKSIARAFDKADLTYPRTAKINAPSFTAQWLEGHSHPLPQSIVKARKYNKMRTTFIDKMIFEHSHNGRIHGQMHPLRSDDGGTVTGRFSYSTPNLQQVPARDPELGPLIRGLFIPEEGHLWGAFDYSQQEPRLVVHYALRTPGITGLDDIVKEYRAEDSTADFHSIVAKMAGLERREAKTINLGLFYGMGKAKLQAELGLSTKQEAEALFNQYHDRVPFVRDLMNETSRWASREGEIRTLLGRGCRFNKWEPAQFGMHTPMTWEDAVKKYGENRIRRAFTYKALNKLIQGSAADMTKKSMLDLYKEGIIAHIQIHDELDLSVESKEHANKIIEIMENAVKLAVPNKVDYESGKNWGDIYD